MKFVVFFIFGLIFHLEALKYDQTKSDVLPSKETCGYQHVNDGGNINGVAKTAEYPWVAFIPVETRTPNPDANVRCTGTLISKRYVITNKSCLQFVLTKVHLGQHDTTKNVTCAESKCKPVVELDIEERVIDEFLDVILLRLEKDVELTDYIKPICLPFEDFTRPEEGSTVYSSGWGLTSLDGHFSTIKKKVKETISSPNECQAYRRASEENTVDDKSMCVRVEDDSVGKPCNGDEGSPVMYNVNGQWILEGVLTWLFDSSSRPCAIDDPAGGTRITEEVLEWIVQHLRP